MESERPIELKGSGYELFILLLSILSIVNVAVILFAREEARQVAILLDLFVVPIFLFDFLYRLATSDARARYFFRRFGWADLLGSWIGLFRIFRIIRVTRLIRAYGWQQMVLDLQVGRAAATFFLTIFLVIVVTEVGGIMVYDAEINAPGHNITSAGDAIWWGLVTITTVGYGDYYPVSPMGRVVGVFMLFTGIALFSVLTGFIANAFLAPRASRRLRAPAGSSLAELEEIRRMLLEQEQQASKVRDRIEQLQRRLDHAREARETREAMAGNPGADA
jgi:voltage-gated potassium channel